MNQAFTEGASKARALWICYGAMMCLAIAVNLPPVYLSTFRETFGGKVGLSSEQLGRIPAFVFGSLTLGILISGPLADRWGAKLFAILGLVLTCAGLGYMGVAGSYEALLASGCVMGLGSGILDMVLSPIVCALRPDRRASAMNLLHSFYCMGAICTVLIGSCALYLNIHWRTVCFALIVFPAGVLAYFVRMKVPPLVEERSQRESVMTLLKHPYLLAALMAILLGGATEQGLSQWLPWFAESSMGYSKASGGMALSGFLVAMVLGRILAAMIGHRVGPIRLMLISCILSVFLFIVGCFCPYSSVALSACIAVGFTGSCLWPTMLGVAANRFPRGGVSMFALLATFGNAGCFIMPWLVGVVAGASSLSLGLATVVFCPALMVPVLIWMRTQPALTTSKE